MSNEVFFKALEEVARKKSRKSVEVLSQYEREIRLALERKYSIRDIVKALKVAFKVKVSEYTLKQYIKNVLKINLKQPKPVKKPIEAPKQSSQAKDPLEEILKG